MGLSVTDLSLLLVVLIWGVNYSIVKSAVSHFYPLTFNSLRFLLASCVVLVILRVLKRPIPKLGRDWLWVLSIGVVGDFIYQLFFIEGIHLTLAGNTSLILASTPVFISLFAHLAGYEKVSRKMWIGIAASFVGIALIIFGGGEKLALGSKTFRGDLIEFVASILWSFYVVFSTPLLKKYGPIITHSATLWVGTVLLLLSAIPSFVAQNWRIITWGDWGGLVFSGIFSIALGQIIWYLGITKIGNARTSTYSNLTPLIGLFVAWPLLGETPSVVQLLGAGAILSGVFMTRLHPESPAAE